MRESPYGSASPVSVTVCTVNSRCPAGQSFAVRPAAESPHKGNGFCHGRHIRHIRDLPNIDRSRPWPLMQRSGERPDFFPGAERNGTIHREHISSDRTRGKPPPGAVATVGRHDLPRRHVASQVRQSLPSACSRRQWHARAGAITPAAARKTLTDGCDGGHEPGAAMRHPPPATRSLITEGTP